MATIAIGDVHGNLAALRDLLEKLRGEAADTLVFLGDYIDRGPDSKGCIDTILALPGSRRGDVVCLRGNHEEWLLKTRADHTRHSWLLGMEAFETVRSYSADAADALRAAADAAGPALIFGRRALPYDVFFDHVPRAHMEFFERLQLYYRVADGICSHAGLDPSVLRVEDQVSHALVWGAPGFPHDYDGAETVAYGHWNNATLDTHGWPQPRIVGATIGVDTISHGVLTAVRLEDRRIFQSARFATDS